MANVLIIDGNHDFCRSLRKVVTRNGHGATSAHSLKHGLREISEGSFDLVFLSSAMDGGRSLDCLPSILASRSRPEVIMVADAGDPDEAEEAIRNGAWDYIQKPSSPEAIVLPIIRALQYRSRTIPAVVTDTSESVKFGGVIGSSPRMKACLELIHQAAGSDANVLITGETGTGKELSAWAIHNNSRRANGNFIVVDCAALPDTLVESTLFGHSKGAFTGADSAQDGLIRQADGGTLFLDEVGELPPEVQTSFLRVLEERRFRAVGGQNETESDFRLIAASNRDLDSSAKSNGFRPDLLFRLRSFTIDLPPLRERKEDIRELVLYHMIELSESSGLRKKELSPEFMEAFLRYEWPGNVRELVHALERSLVAARHEPMLFPKHLPPHIRITLARARITANGESGPASPQEDAAAEAPPTLNELRAAAVSEAERRYLRRLLAYTSGDIPLACRVAGLSRSRLYALLKKYGIRPNAF